MNPVNEIPFADLLAMKEWAYNELNQNVNWSSYSNQELERYREPIRIVEKEIERRWELLRFAARPVAE